ncbi:MAG TPA: non-canonical purine NTP pyrophosphatase [Gemmatimonadales bacterium]|jgi:XTP/dITP diphosphohydrolase|nr:non-canonical purine NTP pyrophosphatase [Gemmatimonadales bacterium]
MNLLIATRSAGKTREIRALFAGSPFTPGFPDELGLEPRPEEADLEAGETYAAHAIAKARYFARRSDVPTAADDSGIEVDALGGSPGVESARWAGERGRGTGEEGVEAANNALLLERLRGVRPERRTARYRCVVAFVATPDADPLVVEGLCEGWVLDVARGTGGFGYDPLFWSLDLGMTFGEAPADAKHRVSHRGRAFRALIEVLRRQQER